MCYVEQIFSEARNRGAKAFVLEAGFAPRWEDPAASFELQDAIQSDVLTAFLFRTMPSSSQARLAMGQPVEFQAQVQGDDWTLRAESTAQGFFVRVSPVQSIEESMTHCLLDEDDDEAFSEEALEDTSKFKAYAQVETSPEQAPEQVLLPPPKSGANADASGDRGEQEDAYEHIHLEQQEEAPKAIQPSFRVSEHWSEAPSPESQTHGLQQANDPGVPGYVEDTPFGLASGAISIGLCDLNPHSGVFNAAGTLLLVNAQDVMEAALEHLADPAIAVHNHSSLFDTYPALDSLKRGSCITVDTEDPSAWFGWIMRRLEQGCAVLVRCRATGELGAMRVLCGLNPEVPTARWLAEHRRVFLPDLESVTALFLGSFERAASS